MPSLPKPIVLTANDFISNAVDNLEKYEGMRVQVNEMTVVSEPERVKPHIWDRWDDIEEDLPDLGQPFFFSAEAERSYWDIDYPEETVLIFGKESVGLAPEIRERYRDRMVKIPMADPGIRSLNLSTSVALAVYEVMRQRR